MELKVKQSSIRFSEAYFYEPNVEVLVLGVGGIGSWTALSLARLDCNIYIQDMDSVDEVNLAGQFMTRHDVGISKVEAVQKNINDFTDNYIIVINEKYDKNSTTNRIVFSCFDNMEARKIAFEKWKAEEDRELFIDGRMALTTGEVYCVLKGNEEMYEKTLFNDSEVADAECTMKATTFNALTIAGIMTGLYCNYIGVRKNPDMPLSLPVKTIYNFPLMTFETYDSI